MDANIGINQAAEDFAAAFSAKDAKDRSAALARLRSDFAAKDAPARRQANLRMRIALLRHWRIAEPVPEVPAKAPQVPPPQPKGVVKLMALDDAARMLMTAPEPPEPAAARPKMAIDFSMFADGDDEETTPDESLDQDSSDESSKTDASSRSDDQIPSEE